MHIAPIVQPSLSLGEWNRIKTLTVMTEIPRPLLFTDNWPKNLTSLQITSSVATPIESWPPQLERLVLPIDYCFWPTDPLPASLRELTCRAQFADQLACTPGALSLRIYTSINGQPRETSTSVLSFLPVPKPDWLYIRLPHTTQLHGELVQKVNLFRPQLLNNSTTRAGKVARSWGSGFIACIPPNIDEFDQKQHAMLNNILQEGLWAAFSSLTSKHPTPLQSASQLYLVKRAQLCSVFFPDDGTDEHWTYPGHRKDSRLSFTHSSKRLVCVYRPYPPARPLAFSRIMRMSKTISGESGLDTNQASSSLLIRITKSPAEASQVADILLDVHAPLSFSPPGASSSAALTDTLRRATFVSVFLNQEALTHPGIANAWTFDQLSSLDKLQLAALPKKYHTTHNHHTPVPSLKSMLPHNSSKPDVIDDFDGDYAEDWAFFGYEITNNLAVALSNCRWRCVQQSATDRSWVKLLENNLRATTLTALGAILFQKLTDKYRTAQQWLDFDQFALWVHDNYASWKEGRWVQKEIRDVAKMLHAGKQIVFGEFLVGVTILKDCLPFVLSIANLHQSHPELTEKKVIDLILNTQDDLDADEWLLNKMQENTDWFNLKLKTLHEHHHPFQPHGAGSGKVNQA